MPRSRGARHRLIAEILGRHAVRSQNDLLDLLAEEGVVITQATLSRDLVELGAVKVRHGRSLVYALPGLGGDATPRPAPDSRFVEERIRKVCTDLLVSAVAAGNQAVLRTPPGAAQYLASALDTTPGLGVLGTIAGDDTVLLILATPEDAGSCVERLLTLSSTT
ncbi:arginine repressor [Mobilicoccus pelagius]|uniref:Arginine repressor n=1 Tax=Mobilicoccus pelagius NBRC 104925 TaxID=1089455 RepID=H5UV24_9MICO|nr:arginine repressor [Mobilicoccus pelagius]GAB49582.1 arginine repressor [Mobilicoccus pelagius NBRC 104925]